MGRALQQDKTLRLGPEELTRFNFKNPEGSILTEKKLNSTIKNAKYISIIDKTLSPKNLMNMGRSVEKKLFRNEGSDKKMQTIGKVLGHHSIK